MKHCIKSLKCVQCEKWVNVSICERTPYMCLNCCVKAGTARITEGEK